MQKYIIGGIVVIILAVVGLYMWKSNTAEPVVVDNTPPAPIVPIRQSYATSTYSLTYPDGYTVDAAYAYQGVPKKPIPGVKFVIPMTMATGTNLSTDSGVSIESLPRATKCTGDIYLYDNVKATDLTVGSTTFSVATTSGAGAGNLYEEHVYALKGSSPCTAVRYLVHSTQLANYPEGTVRAYDSAALMKDFDSIRDSIKLNQ